MISNLPKNIWNAYQYISGGSELGGIATSVIEKRYRFKHIAKLKAKVKSLEINLKQL
jgi:hypothetical protein